MAYDPAFPRAHYDRVADDEWTRLTRSRRGELNFLVHMDVLRGHIATDMDVLEIGAGSGVYTKELVHMARRPVVSDFSEVQLSLNRDHMRDLGVLDLVDDYTMAQHDLRSGRRERRCTRSHCPTRALQGVCGRCVWSLRDIERQAAHVAPSRERRTQGISQKPTFDRTNLECDPQGLSKRFASCGIQPLVRCSSIFCGLRRRSDHDGQGDAQRANDRSGSAH